ncbi:MAG: hypothetical protein H0X17_02405 [Deltaproteobacteria bacterium]|nr:hypothetical protein [Deltaproteobacteria bacterium]
MMPPLWKLERPHDLAFIGHQLGIDPDAAELPRAASWVAWFFAVLAWLALARGNVWESLAEALAVAIAATAVAAGTSLWVAHVRRELRVHQTRVFEMELACATGQRIPIDGNVDLMKAVVSRVITPLADELGIERIEMGSL